MGDGDEEENQNEDVSESMPGCPVPSLNDAGGRGAGGCPQCKRSNIQPCAVLLVHAAHSSPTCREYGEA